MYQSSFHIQMKTEKHHSDGDQYVTEEAIPELWLNKVMIYVMKLSEFDSFDITILPVYFYLLHMQYFMFFGWLLK